MLENEGVFGRLEQRIRALDVPVAIKFWNGREMGAEQPPRVRVTVRSPTVLPALVRPTMGNLAKHYVEERLDLDGEARQIIRLGEAFAGATALSKSARLRRWMRHTRAFDSKAIRQHYDVNDDFFALWLDPKRVYSCAYFRRPDDTLECAQEQKLDHICRKLMLKPGERFLDVGCGWGALILWAAEHYRVHATGITLSEHQYNHATNLIRDRGLQDLCEVRLLDYRDVPENDPYDKIASVGMFEHVGRKNLALYFRKLHDLLKPGGLVMNHGITLNSLEQDELGSDIGEFIDEYVFPGGELTHVSNVLREMSAQGLEGWDVESLRPHYARTLWHWVERLENNQPAALAQVGEKIYRIWRIYMAGSAHAFDRGWMSIYQILAGRAREDGRLSVPATREYIYAA